jgi:hypothetical protein
MEVSRWRRPEARAITECAAGSAITMPRAPILGAWTLDLLRGAGARRSSVLVSWLPAGRAGIRR